VSRLLLTVDEQFSGRNAQCIGDHEDIDETDVSLAPLDRPDVRAVEAGSLRELFLGQSNGYSSAANRLPEEAQSSALASRRASHIGNTRRLLLIGRQTMSSIRL
jgi:hypothetical protein